MRRIVTFVGCWVLALAVTSVASADVVANFWDNVMASGVTAGQKIRVVFITSATTPADSGAWSTYDGFGDLEATSGIVTGTLKSDYEQDLPVQWQPLVTTSDTSNPHAPVDSRRVADWINHDEYENLPVFNTRGDRVAVTSAAMLTSPLDAAIKYDQSADDKAPSGSVAVWTGTNSDGMPYPGAPIDSQYYLGYDTGNNDASIAGNGGDKDNWLAAAVLPWQANVVGAGFPGLPDGDLIARSIYVMSGEVTVVPEPSTILLWLGITGIAGVMFWRKRRSS